MDNKTDKRYTIFHVPTEHYLVYVVEGAGEAAKDNFDTWLRGHLGDNLDHLGRYLGRTDGQGRDYFGDASPMGTFDTWVDALNSDAAQVDR